MTVQLEISRDMQRKLDLIDSLCLYSDLSVETIAQTADMDVKYVQKIIDNLIRKDAVEALYEQSNMSIEHVMKKDVASLDCSKTALDAATLMIEKGVGCVVVTVQGRPFGMITERDILCQMIVFDKRLADISLEVIASRPLIRVSPIETVGKVADLMMKNSIRRVPVVEDDNLVGMVVVKDLAMLLSSTKRPSLAKAILKAISGSRNI
ncbi:MAG: CBS domain-containing protein [Nitrosotalea sp.]